MQDALHVAATLFLFALLILITWIVYPRDEELPQTPLGPTPAQAPEPESVPVLSPDLLPPDTTVEAANGLTYTVAEIQALNSQFTPDEWKQLVALAAKHHAPQVRLD